MSDEIKEEKELTHGFEIHAGDHKHALDYIGSHMNEQQVKDMVHRAESGHSAHFMVSGGGHEGNYKLEKQDGKLKIHRADY